VKILKSHVMRPVYVVLVLVVGLLAFRYLYVPTDFGVHDRGFTYGWYRQGNIADWRQVTIKYQGRQSCKRCHPVEYDKITQMPHAIIQCENCHGPAMNHPYDPKKLPLDTSRELCLRCHSKLPYPGSARGELRGVDPATHHPGVPCVDCHIPHQPALQHLQSAGGNPRHENDYCRQCHRQQVDTLSGTPHAIIYCESCHGPAKAHPSKPAKLEIDATRDLCLTCHPDKKRHNISHACVTCHDPHQSGLEHLQFLPVSDEDQP
jgi:predicted CXXCH cytochrome family protein